MRKTALIACTFLTLWISPAQAGAVPCYGRELAEAWQRGHAAFQSGDHDSAQALLIPLAENGFAPAQWLVGRMVASGLGTAKNEEAGYLWLRLARLREFPLARRNSDDIEDRLDYAKASAINAQAERWRPSLRKSCSRAEESDLRFSVAPALSGQKERLYRWWASLVVAGAEIRADAVPYLRSVDRVMFTDDNTVNASILRDDGGSILQVSAEMSALPMDKALDLLMPAVREMVNDRMISAVTEAPVQTYRGMLLRGHPGADNAPFFDLWRLTLDMADKLPPALRNKVSTVREIRYWPNMKYGAFVKHTPYKSRYVEDKRAAGGGYLAFQHDAKTVAGAAALGGLLGAHINRVEKVQNQSALNCRISRDLLSAATALQWDEQIRTGLRRRMQEDACPS